jgi:hypothetical protein
MQGRETWSNCVLELISVNNGPCHVSGYFLPFKGKSHLRSSQAARFFSFAKGKKNILQKESRSHDTGPLISCFFYLRKGCLK